MNVSIEVSYCKCGERGLKELKELLGVVGFDIVDFSESPMLVDKVGDETWVRFQIVTRLSTDDAEKLVSLLVAPEPRSPNHDEGRPAMWTN